MSEIPLVDTIATRENLIRVLDNLKEGIIAHDMQRRIYFFNAEAERVTGFSREEVLGKDCHDVFEGPFCGQRCSFCDGSDFCEDRLEYPLTLSTKSGEQRRVRRPTRREVRPIGRLARQATQIRPHQATLS